MIYLAIDAVRESSPTTWNWPPLKRVARLRRTKNLTRDAVLLSVSAERGVEERPPDGGRQLPSEETIADYWMVEPGDLVFNPMWAIGGGVAASSVHGAVSPAYRVYEPGSRLSSRFLHYWARSGPAVKQYELMTRGDTTFDRSVTRADFEGMPVPLPSRPDQMLIVDFLDVETARIDALIGKTKRLITLTAEHFRASLDSSFRADSGQVRLGRFVTRLMQGTSPEAENREADGEEWGVLMLSAVRFGRYRPEKNKALPAHYLPDASLVPRRGDLLVTRSNTPEHVGDACAVDAEAPFRMLCDLIYLTRLDRRLDPRYAAYALLTSEARLQVESAARGSSQSMVKLRGEDIKGIEIPYVPLREQGAIVETIEDRRSRADRLTAVLQRQIALLREHRQALITGAVTGHLDVSKAAA